jgi:DMSO/TMAO reductase YedYZ heme-binding membrane subunit
MYIHLYWNSISDNWATIVSRHILPLLYTGSFELLDIVKYKKKKKKKKKKTTVSTVIP